MRPKPSSSHFSQLEILSSRSLWTEAISARLTGAQNRPSSGPERCDTAVAADGRRQPQTFAEIVERPGSGTAQSAGAWSSRLVAVRAPTRVRP